MSKKNIPTNSTLYKNISKSLLEFLSGRKYIPLSGAQLIKRLAIAKEHQPLFKEILENLTEEGVLECKSRKYGLKKLQAHLVKGTIRIHVRGFGFVQPLDTSECEQDIFIPKHLTENAIDGDEVEVEINPDSNSPKGPEGRVIKILKRGRTHMGGIIQKISPEGALLVYCPLLGTSKHAVVDKASTAHEIGERVILKILKWGNEESPTQGEISQVLGSIHDPSIDHTAAIEEYDLNSTFPKTVLQQTKKYGSEVTPQDLKGRKDLTPLEIVTIDPETAKDFDDALSLTQDKNGHYHLGVHIADVAHYVPADSPLDVEAFARSNSTYFPGFCLPMLPHELSDQLCSLRPDVIRLTASVLMEFDKNGTLLNTSIVRSFIKSQKRFSYEEAKEVLDGKKESPHAALLQRMVDLCLLLKKKRHERGSIDFALPDLVIVVNEKGVPTGTKWVEYDITHQLVEEYMLKANEVVAKHLSDAGNGLLFRIHENPDQENLQEFYNLAATLGFSLPKEPTQKDLQKLFESAKETPFIQQLSVGFIRSMKLAYYSADNVGHFGLALEYYCHFTSPIRRYTDLIIQRLLFKEIEGDIDLKAIAKKCSEQERLSFRAETSVKNLKKLRLLSIWMGQDPEKAYEAIITRVKPFGLSFELPALMIEGFVHISELGDDYFVYNQEQSVLVGRFGGTTHRLGGKLSVRPVAIDFILLESKWELVGKTERKGKRRR